MEYQEINDEVQLVNSVTTEKQQVEADSGEQSPQWIIKPESAGDKRDPIKGILAKIKEGEFKSGQKLVDLCAVAKGNYSEEDIALNPETPINPKEDLSGYLKQTRIEIIKKEQEKEEINRELAELYTQQAERRETVRQISETIDELAQKKGISRLLARRKMGKLFDQRRFVGLEIDGLEKTIRTGDFPRKVENLDKSIQIVMFQQAHQLGEVAVEEIIGSLDNYAELLDATKEDDEISGQVKENYIDDVVKPFVEERFKDYLSEENIQNFISKITAEIVRGEKVSFEDIPDYMNYLSAINSLMRPISDESVFAPCIDMVAVMVRSEQSRLREILIDELVDDKENPKFQVKVDMTYQSPRQGIDRGTTTEAVYKALGLMPTTPEANIDVWAAFKESPRAREIFDQSITDTDQKVYNNALRVSVNNSNHYGNEVQQLALYSTPEAIRNLILLTAAQENDNFRSNDANTALFKAARRKDWSLKVDNALAQYPELVGMHDLLINWDSNGLDYPDLNGKVDDFAESILENSDDVGLKRYARKSLSLERLIKTSTKEGEIAFELKDMHVLIGAVNVLKEAEEMQDKNLGSGLIDSNKFTHQIRKSLSDYTEGSWGGETEKENAISLKAISQEIVASRGNIDKLLFLNYEAINTLRYSKKELGVDGRQAVLKLWDTHPNIINSKELLDAVVAHPDELLSQDNLDLLDTLFLKFSNTQVDLPLIIEVYATRENPNKKLFFDLVEKAPTLFTEEFNKIGLELLTSSEAVLKDDSDIDFFNNVLEKRWDKTGVIAFINFYIEGTKNGSVTSENRNFVLEAFKDFSDTYTTISFERAARLAEVRNSFFGKAIQDLQIDEVGRNRMLMDYSCFNERLETNKVEYMTQSLKSVESSDQLFSALEYLRWLPDSEISSVDNIESLELKYKKTQDKLKEGFRKIFPNSQEICFSRNDLSNLISRLNDICDRFGFESKRVAIDGIELNLPTDFVREFNELKRQIPQAEFVPELASFLIKEAGKKTTAYTIEDLMFSQIGDTEDLTGRRRGQYEANQLLEVMENNVEASLFTWTSAIEYQNEKPNSPLFIIANERTGPADLAAEYLPRSFADNYKIQQEVDYDKFFSWFKENEGLVENLFERSKKGEDVTKDIPAEIVDLLGIKDNKLIPIYRLKVPSSLDASSAEPAGVNTILNFMKFTSIMGGRTLFMDESTRSAPRSIECMYNVINRRQNELGGAKIKLMGKINGVVGQNGTTLSEINPRKQNMEVAFIDPWHSQIKSITDDSVGFVPEVTGAGIIEVVTPGYTSVSPYGIDTIQDFWKQMIANEVALRFGGFTESGKKRKEEFKHVVDRNEQILSQNELRDMAFNRPYRALAIDLDGTVGSRGEYDPQIIERIKEIAGKNADVVISTCRSLVNHPEYDGSLDTFIHQLGDLTEEQMDHIYLATENAAIITALSDTENPIESSLISDDAIGLIYPIVTSIVPSARTFNEQGSVVLRNFELEKKEKIIENLNKEFEKEGLLLKAMSDSKRSISIRSASATKRNVLNWLEKKGTNVDDIAKIGDAPNGNDRSMFWGRGSFNIGKSRGVGTLWTIDVNENGGGISETEKLLGKLQFVGN